MSAVGVITFLSLLDADPSRQPDVPSRAPAVEIDRIEPSRCSSSARLSETISHYDFFGSRAAEADKSFRQRLLVSNDFAGQTKRFAGQADWYIEWSTCLEPVGAGCRVAGVTSTVHVTYTLPRWADRDAASPALRARWDRYANNLLTHEKGHGTVALKVAHLLEKDLVGMTDLADCEAVRSEATARVDRVMRKGETMQNEYDRWTEHGGTQGAIFPF